MKTLKPLIEYSIWLNKKDTSDVLKFTNIYTHFKANIAHRELYLDFDPKMAILKCITFKLLNRVYTLYFQTLFSGKILFPKIEEHKQ